MSFLSPVWLWGLFSLLIPPLIHLLSRKPPKSVPVGSLKPFLSAASRRPRRIQLENPWLMLLRMLMLAFLFLWLAEPVWYKKLHKDKKQLVLVHPEAPKETWQGLHTEQNDLRWLQNGLPSISDSLNDNEEVDLWWLLAQADNYRHIHDTLWVISPLEQGYFGRQRPALRHAVLWLPFVSVAEKPQHFPVQAGQSVKYTTLVNDSLQYWQTDTIARSSSAQKKDFTLTIAYDKDLQADADILAQAFGAAALASPHVQLQINKLELPATTLPEGRLVWLSAEAAPENSWLWLKERKGEDWLVTEESGYTLSARPSVYRHQPARLAELPEALANILPSLESANRLPMPEMQAMPVKSLESDPQKPAGIPLADFVLMAFLGSLVWERWLRRNA